MKNELKKIASILGARPQFVKAAVLSRIIRERNNFSEIIIHTGQHYDPNMSEVFFKEMSIPEPTYNLDINGVGHGAMTGRMLEKIEAILLDEKPDLVVVYGDTNSTLAGALAAKKLGIQVVHIEAGLRSYNMSMPEEINRILTDRISDILFCPTLTATMNLQKEGFDLLDSKVILSGDIMKDSVLYYGELSANRSDIINHLGLNGKDFILTTIHRQENTDDKNRLGAIIQALNDLSEDQLIILPLHPRTKAKMNEFNLTFKGITIDPVGYFDMLELLKKSRLVITDSGGLQKEAFFNHSPCVIIREETEWVELVEEGYARIAGHDQQKIKSECLHYLSKPPVFDKELYGNHVGEKIYDEISTFLGV